jgi:hypothetical protein
VQDVQRLFFSALQAPKSPRINRQDTTAILRTKIVAGNGTDLVAAGYIDVVSVPGSDLLHSLATREVPVGVRRRQEDFAQH